ncbi:MAG: type II toxin-antitoxin system VapC family toxin [Isosphaeraceae bacterium]
MGSEPRDYRDRRKSASRYAIKMLDAIHVASAVVHGADCFITNDQGIRRIQEIQILILSDYLPIAP